MRDGAAVWRAARAAQQRRRLDATDNTVIEALIEEFWRVIRLDPFGTFPGCRVGIPEIIRPVGDR